MNHWHTDTSYDRANEQMTRIDRKPLIEFLRQQFAINWMGVEPGRRGPDHAWRHRCRQNRTGAGPAPRDGTTALPTARLIAAMPFTYDSLMLTTHVLYLHGFRSSPLSNKARMTAAAVSSRFPHVTWLCPMLAASPAQAIDELVQAVADWPHASMAVIGSSLGGFYATWLAEHFGCKAVLLNPAVHPSRDLAAHIGSHELWHDPDQHFYFEPAFVAELQTQEVLRITRPERYFAVIAKGDEVLDWQEMTGHYPGARIKLLAGGDHALGDYEQHLDEVLSFLELG